MAQTKKCPQCGKSIRFVPAMDKANRALGMGYYLAHNCEPVRTKSKPKVTIDQVIEAVEADDCLGFCTACGAEAFNVEPDAHEYECESCGEHKVYGAEELLLMMA